MTASLYTAYVVNFEEQTMNSKSLHNVVEVETQRNTQKMAKKLKLTKLHAIALTNSYL